MKYEAFYSTLLRIFSLILQLSFLKQSFAEKLWISLPVDRVVSLQSIFLTKAIYSPQGSKILEIIIQIPFTIFCKGEMGPASLNM